MKECSYKCKQQEDTTASNEELITRALLSKIPTMEDVSDSGIRPDVLCTYFMPLCSFR